VVRELNGEQDREGNLKILHKILEGNQDAKLLPSVIECFLHLGDYATALERIPKIEDKYGRANLQLEIVRLWLEQGEKEKASHLLMEIMPSLDNIPPQYGDPIKAHILASLYLGRLRGQPYALSGLDKAFTSWNSIAGPSYQKDVILYLILQLENCAFPDIPGNVRQLLIEKSEQIEDKTYRLWAMQKVAETMCHFNHFSYIFEVMEKVSPESDGKLQLLGTYAMEAIKRDRIGETFALLKTLPFPNEREVFIKQLANGLETKKDLDRLCHLYLEIPGDFSLFCYVTTKVLSVALQMYGKEIFCQWCSSIAHVWGIQQ
jgi:hypothetical protein